MSDELHAGHREGRGEVGAERFWENHYRGRERVWSGRPNPVLVDVVGGLRPGTALDLGCGKGGDAIWLARQGWRVTAVDLSATALGRAAADAATAGVADRIDFRQHDFALAFPSGVFDLVSAQYLHSPIELPRVHVLREAASAVASGGLLLIVDHASVSPGSWAVPEETLAPLDLSPDEWHTERLEAREREATGPNGQRATVTDNIICQTPRGVTCPRARRPGELTSGDLGPHRVPLKDLRSPRTATCAPCGREAGGNMEVTLITL